MDTSSDCSGVKWWSSERMRLLPLIKCLQDLDNNPAIVEKLKQLGLEVVFIAWEDSARSKNSISGPNISDMSLCVCDKALMPVIRVPNKEDITVDLPIERIKLTVGNEKISSASYSIDGVPKLKQVSLQEYLENIGSYTNNPSIKSLYRPRDANLVASAQACILPLQDGKIAFHVRMLNYQSYAGSPAVLLILASAQGTSAQFLDYRGRLYFNDAGTAVELVAKRLEDDRRERQVEVTGAMNDQERDRNVLYIIQVPLVVKKRTMLPYQKLFTGVCLGTDGGGWGGSSFGGDSSNSSNNNNNANLSGQFSFGAAPLPPAKARGVDHAMIEKSTESQGSFRGLEDAESVERDERFPVRITAQFYSATDTPEIPDQTLEYFHERIQSIYSHGKNQSSLVTQGQTNRPTEHSVAVDSLPKGFSF